MNSSTLKQENVQTHVQVPLQRLASADQVCQTNSVDRFQRKLTVGLCRDLRKGVLARLAARGVTVSVSGQDVPLDRAIFASEVHGLVGTRIQAYEVDYFMHVFDR